MILNIHAGHNPDGKIACGAIGLVKESTEARIIKDKVIDMLKSQGHTVYDCTVDNGLNESDQLRKIVEKCNQHNVDLDISIHLNAGANKAQNGVTTGTEIYVLSSNSRAKAYAQNIVNSISSLGFKNRGVKYSTSLYVLKYTNSPAMLIEVCFVDDPDDIKIYNADNVAQAIVKGITGTSSSIPVQSPGNQSFSSSNIQYYRVQCGAFSSKANADALATKLKLNGFSTLVKQYDNLYKVQIGAFSQKVNAEAMLNQVKAKGFDAFITYC